MGFWSEYFKSRGFYLPSSLFRKYQRSKIMLSFLIWRTDGHIWRCGSLCDLKWSISWHLWEQISRPNLFTIVPLYLEFTLSFKEESFLTQPISKDGVFQSRWHSAIEDESWPFLNPSRSCFILCFQAGSLSTLFLQNLFPKVRHHAPRCSFLSPQRVLETLLPNQGILPLQWWLGLNSNGKWQEVLAARKGKEKKGSWSGGKLRQASKGGNRQVLGEGRWS